MENLKFLNRIVLFISFISLIGCVLHPSRNFNLGLIINLLNRCSLLPIIVKKNATDENRFERRRQRTAAPISY